MGAEDRGARVQRIEVQGFRGSRCKGAEDLGAQRAEDLSAWVQRILVHRVQRVLVQWYIGFWCMGAEELGALGADDLGAPMQRI